MKLALEEIKVIIREELESFLLEKDNIRSDNPRQGWEILLYSKKADRGDKSIRSIIKRQKPQSYGKEHMCRAQEGNEDPDPRHVMITPSLMINIRNLATQTPKKFRLSNEAGSSGYIRYLNRLQKIAVSVARQIWPQINKYFSDPNLKGDNHYIYARYNCTDEFGMMMTYLEADKDFLREK